ncbi:MAG: hypothetical protein MPL62_18225 [Alphaproteobacteria bacterium]|nr:hypothetical protein [Alphaproteobacteria bacterium]
MNVVKPAVIATVVVLGALYANYLAEGNRLLNIPEVFIHNSPIRDLLTYFEVALVAVFGLVIYLWGRLLYVKIRDGGRSKRRYI